MFRGDRECMAGRVPWAEGLGKASSSKWKFTWVLRSPMPSGVLPSGGQQVVRDTLPLSPSAGPGISYQVTELDRESPSPGRARAVAVSRVKAGVWQVPGDTSHSLSWAGV